MTVADQLWLHLLQTGVRQVFGVPGGAIEPFFDALARARRRGEVRCVPARNEAAAVMMAEGTVREGAPLGVCCATSGPGALNMLSATASALMEQQPVLVLTGQVPLPKMGQGPMQDSSCDAVDVVAAFKSVTKYSTLVSHPQQLVPKLVRALALALTTPRGPVHLSLPSDVMGALVDSGLCYSGLPQSARPTCTPAAVQQVRRLLAQAQRPVLLLGEEAEGAAESVLAFLRAWPLPVVTSAAGHRWFRTDHTLYRGVHGFAGHAQAAELLRDSDCVLMLGSQSREFCAGNAEYLRSSRVIAVSENLRTLTSNVGAGLHVHADIGLLLDQLSGGATSDLLREQHWLRLGSPPFQLPQAPAGALASTARTRRMSPVHALRTLWERLPRDTHVYLDAGNAWCWGLHYLPIDDRASRVMTSMGFGQMTWAISAAIGAALQRGPGGAVLCVTGDGSWLMSSHELTVAVQQRLPVVFVVLNDAHLGMVYHGQRMTGAEAIAHELPPVDFAAMAQACGAMGLKVTDLRQLMELTPEDLFGQGPVVLDLHVDPEVVPPMRARVDQLREAAGREGVSASQALDVDTALASMQNAPDQ